MGISGLEVIDYRGVSCIRGFRPLWGIINQRWLVGSGPKLAGVWISIYNLLNLNHAVAIGRKILFIQGCKQRLNGNIE